MIFIILSLSQKEALKLLTKPKYFPNLPTATITNVLRISIYNKINVF